MRFFNTAGPIQPQHHYHIPPLERLDLDRVRTLIRQQKYFVLHAPRQTGKTSALLALRDLLNAEDSYRCVYVNVEGAQALREDVEQVMRTLLAGLASRARLTLGDEFFGECLVGHPRRGRAGRWVTGGVDALGRGQPQALGAAHRRD